MSNRNMKTRLYTTLFASVMVCLTFAQSDVPFDKQHFNDKDALKGALSELKSGNKLFDKGGFYYASALPHFEKANAFNPDNAELNLKIGLCHLNGAYQYKSLVYFQKANDLIPDIPRINYLIGVAHQLNANWDEAIEAFNTHLKLTKRAPDENTFYNNGEKRIVECKSGKALQNSPIQNRVEVLSTSVNSSSAEYGIVISPDAEEMYYTSRREGTTGGQMDESTNDYFEDIYHSKKVNGEWQAPEVVAAPVNSNSNDATIGLFNDGSTLLMYRDNGGTGDILESVNEGGVWSTPKSIGDNINTEHHESSAWFSFDKKFLFFVSDRPDMTTGGLDIFRSRWNESDKTWGPPENLGRKVNSQYDEDGIYVHPDGKTIYFSSEGHNSMGGFDIFSTELVEGEWTEPTNLGWPINSPGDDVYFVVTADGSKGYFSSVRPDGFGKDDLYVAHIGANSLDTSATAMDGDDVALGPLDKKSTILMKGTIEDSENGEPVEAKIELFDIETGKTIALFKSKAADGSYVFAVPANSAYGVNIFADDYLFHSENIELPTDGAYTEHAHDIDLQGLRIGNGIVLNNVFFDHDKAELTDRSVGELQKILALMEQNPTLVLELSGHTDSNGASSYNENLSQRRAKTCKEWLVKWEVSADRLVAKGYGESVPAANNATEEGRAKNRRTELKILGK